MERNNIGLGIFFFGFQSPREERLFVMIYKRVIINKTILVLSGMAIVC